MGGLREVAAPFVVPSPLGVAIRTRLKHLSAADEEVLRLVGDLLGSLASRDLKARCSAGLEHDSERWAERKRVLTGESSSRWAGSITRATHDQWALARRGQLAHVHSLEAGIATITRRLSLPVGEKGTKQAPITWPPGAWTPTATRAANPDASATTSPAPPPTGTPRCGTP